MTDREEICELMSRYCWHVDHLQWDQWLDLFTMDAIWGAGDFGPFKGREAMIKLTRSLEKLVKQGVSRHYIANEVIELDGDKGTLRAYIMVVSAETQLVKTLGEYEITVARAGGRWLIRTLDFFRISPARAAEAAPA